MALLRVQAPQIIGIMNPNKFAINFKTLPFRFMAIELDVYFGDFISPNYWKTLALGVLATARAFCCIIPFHSKELIEMRDRHPAIEELVQEGRTGISPQDLLWRCHVDSSSGECINTL